MECSRLLLVSQLLLLFYSVNSQSYLESAKQRLNQFKKSYNNSQSDIIIFLDVSGSVSDFGFRTEKYFVSSLLNEMNVASYSTRVAVVTFGKKSKTDVNYINLEGQNTEDTTKCEFNKIFDHQVNHRKASATNMHSAFLEGNKILEEAKRFGWKRNNVNTVALLITDGHWNMKSPLEQADKMKNGQFSVDVFTIGVGWTSEAQLKALASSQDKYIYASSFTSFKQLARYIRGDAHEKEYQKVSNNKCSTTCHSQAVCTCGTVAGKYVCSCLAGYSGNGITCTRCPRGSYKDYPSPEKCKPCPKNSNTDNTGGKTIDSCRCKSGYEGDPKRKIECTPIKCDPIGAPQNGKMTGPDCNRIFRGKCFFECNTGYLRDGPPFRECMANRKWSGKNVACDVIKCNDIPSLHHGSAVCTGFKYQDHCSFTCNKGYELIGSNKKTCQANGQWTGSHVVRCEAKKCPVLRKLPYGQVEPVDCITRSQHYGAGCIFKCAVGYTMQGNGNLRCQEDGTWTDTVPTCKDTQPPQIVCPKTITTETDKGKHFATVDYPSPEYWDNSQLFGNADVKVKKIPEGIKSPYVFQIGLTNVQYTVEDQEGNINRCSFNVLVEDKEPPRTISCPKDKVVRTKSLYDRVNVTWDPVLFTDNCGAEKLTIVQSAQNNSEFSVGEHRVAYTAKDKSTNIGTCEFLVIVQTGECKYYPPPVNGGNSLKVLMGGHVVSIFCNQGFEFATKPEAWYQCFSDGTWITFPTFNAMPWPDCTVEFNADAMKGFEFNYLTGNCNDPKVQLEAKKAFLKQFNIFLLDFYPDYCDVEQSCSVENVVIECGVVSQGGRRRKRGIPGQSLLIDLEVKIENKKGRSPNVLIESLNKATAELKNTRKLDKVSTSTQTLNIKNFYDSLAEVSCKNGSIFGMNVDHNQKCQSCPSGTMYDTKTKDCKDCPKDTYQEETGRFHCNKCRQGTFTVGTKSKNATDCRAKCPAGEYSDNGLENCLACPIGFYQNIEGEKSCIKCPGKTITTSVGAKSISECGVPCAPGSYSSTGVEVCKLCPVGQYQTSWMQKSCTECLDGYTTTSEGATSESECQVLDPCNINPCDNGGSCKSRKNDYECVCKPGYKGGNCEEEINECESNPCYKGATCLDKVNGYVCICAPGQSGKHCNQKSRSFCSNQPCQHGSCIEEPDRFICNCNPGYTGQFCESEINECGSNPCENGGLCIDRHPGYDCQCLTDWQGVRCEINMDGCASDPCLNNARCESLGGNFHCHCPAGYRGKNCEVNVNECASTPCRNNGKCVDLVNGYKCECDRNFGGKNCEIAQPADYDLYFNDELGVSSSTINLKNDISAFTIAFWMKVSDAGNTDPGTPISYAVEHQGNLYDNALVIHDYTGFNIYINNEKYETDIDGDDGKWHHIVVTWQSSNGNLMLFKDGSRVSSGNIQKNKIIPGGGLLVLGQEQDIVGGNFSASEAFNGYISQVNMWNNVLSLNDIQKLATYCAFEKYGNIVAWGDFLNGLEGNARKIQPSQACKENRCWGNWLSRGTRSSCSNPSAYDCQTINGISLKNVDLVEKLNIKCTSQGVQCQDTAEDTCPAFKVRFACPCSVGSICTSQTCQNSGTCLNRINGYECKCKDGFTGDRCQTELHCPNPRPFAHGTVTGTRFSPGQRVTFNCNRGFKLVGSRELICRKGKWEGTVPSCLDIDECAVGYCKQRVCKNTLGGYQCNCGKGYRQGPPGTCEDINECEINNGNCQGMCKNTRGGYSCLPCSANTKLTKDGLKCEDIDECATNGGRGPCDHFCQNIYGGYRCKCRQGFSPDGDTCGATSCPRINTPANGKTLPSSVTSTIDEVVSFSCNQNYKLNGPKSRTCLADGTWSGSQPICSLIRCHPAPLLKNGRRSSSSNHAGSQITYTCNSGYKMVGESKVTCQENMEWSSPAPRCIRTDCLIPSAPNNGKVVGSQTTIESIILYQCLHGYTFGDTNSKTYAECLTNKQWSNPTPSCQIISCGDPGGVSHGKRLGTTFTYNSTLTYSCHNGYKITGSTTRTCQLNGKWSGIKPQCLVQSCGDPGTPAHSLKIGEEYTYNKEVSFKCIEGYIMSGSASRTCQTNGQWSGAQPTCQLVNCGDPGTPTNGERSGADTHAGSTLFYECKPGYMPVGETKLICGDDGVWSSPRPVCKVSSCGGLLIGPTGSLKSPNFPNPYGNNRYCRWKITVPVNKKVLIKFKSLDSEGKKDWVIVSDPTTQTIITVLSGINANEMLFTSSSNEMEVKFTSDSQRESNGFEATYEQVSCGGIITDLNTVIQSPYYPNQYPAGLTCVWQVLLPGKPISLSFENFYTQQSYDYLKVYNRVDKFNGNTLVARYSGYLGIPSPLESLSGYLHIVFSSNARTSYRGFKAKVVKYRQIYGK